MMSLSFSQHHVYKQFIVTWQLEGMFPEPLGLYHITIRLLTQSVSPVLQTL